MALYIHCGYSRVAVRELMTKNSTSNRRHQLSEELIVEYNTLFEGYPNMKLDGKPDYMLKKCKEFSRKNGIPRTQPTAICLLFHMKCGKNYQSHKSFSTHGESVRHAQQLFPP